MKKNIPKTWLLVLLFVLLAPLAVCQSQYPTTFIVDMTDADPFNPDIDDVYITGSFAGWVEPGTNPDYKLEPTEPGSMFYSITITIDTGEIEYKYFRVIDNAPSWEYGEWPGSPNRIETVYFSKEINNIWGIINQNFNVTFMVDMSLADPFNPNTDDVYITGNFTGWCEPGTDTLFRLIPLESDSLVYTISLNTAEGEIIYKYFRVIDNIPSWDNGEWSGDPNRIEFINDDLTIYDIWGDVLSDISNYDNFSNTIIYPNPATEILNVQNASEIFMMEVIDIFGNEVKTIHLSDNKLTINISTLQSGIYLLRIHDSEGTHTKKVIKK